MEKQGTTSLNGVKLSHYCTLELTIPCHGTNRYMTTENWFTSVPFILDMLTNCRLSLFGTAGANKKKISSEMKNKEAKVQD